MRFVLFTYPDPEYAARWDAMSEEERAGSLTEHIAWFERYGDRITGGADPAWPQVIPPRRRRLRPLAEGDPHRAASRRTAADHRWPLHRGEGAPGRRDHGRRPRLGRGD